MSGQSTTIRYTLERILASVRQQALNQSVASKAKNPADPTQAEFWNKLALQEATLRHILRQLKGKHVALQNERTQLWRIPREQRYSARQSVNDREVVNLDLIELAETTLRALIDLGGGVTELKTGDWEDLGQKACELVEKIDKSLVHTVVHQLREGPAFDTANHLPGFGIDHLAPLIGLIIALIHSKLRTKRH